MYFLPGHVDFPFIVVYDIENNNFSQSVDIPIDFTIGANCLANDNSDLIWITGSANGKDLYIYNIVYNNFTYWGNTLYEHSGPSCAIYNNTMYIAGGFETKIIEAIDISTNNINTNEKFEMINLFA